MPSENIAELRVMKAAMNFVTAISALPIRAAKMTFFEPEATFQSSFASLRTGSYRLPG
jgi:hypothetical protein